MFFGGLPLSPFRKEAAGEKDCGEVRKFDARVLR